MDEAGAGVAPGAAKRRIPSVLRGVRPVDKRRIPAEVIAGITLAALAIPEVMGYTTIAGMPVITGLYTILLPIALFALLGSSRHLVVGADSATAAIMAAGLAGLAAAGSSEYVALAGMLAMIAGVYLLLARVFRLGFLADFLSRTVLIGFLTGVGIQVACGQLSGLFGIPKEASEPIGQIVETITGFGSVSWTTTAVSASVLLVILVGKRIWRRVPWAIIAVMGAIASSALLSLPSHGVATLGMVPSGLPSLSFPKLPAGDVATLLGTAFSIFIVVLAQSAATSRAYAAKFGDDFEENADLVGLGLANIGAGLSGAFVVNGSPTKTAMVDDAGGRSQLAQLTAAAVVLVVLLFLTKPLGYMPNAVLAAVVFLIGAELVDVKGMRKIFRMRPVEFGVALTTAVTVVLVGVEVGIILAIVLSIIAHLRHSYRPYNRLLFPTAGGDWGSGPLTTGVQAAPGLLIYRFGASLYYANASRFASEVREVLRPAGVSVRWFCLAASNIGDLDYSGSAVLRAVITELRERGVTFVLCDATAPVLAELERDDLLGFVGKEYVYTSAREVLAAYAALPHHNEAPGAGSRAHSSPRGGA